MSEEEVVTPDPNDDTEITEEVKALVGEEASKDAKVLSALIGAKKALRASERRVKELEPVANRSREIEDKLEAASPYIAAIANNPRLKAEALRAVTGTRTTGERVEQPTEDEDPDAAAVAEELGLYQSDQSTPDIARARRVLNRLDQRNGRQTDERIRPFAGAVLGSRAETTLNRIAALTDDNGTPLATIESINEVASKLPRHLLANEDVAELVLNSAIGIDRRKGRTPKPQDEPVFLERQGGRRVARSETIDEGTRASLERLGISEKDYAASSKRLEEGVQNRRGIALGVKSNG